MSHDLNHAIRHVPSDRAPSDRAPSDTGRNWTAEARLQPARAHASTARRSAAAESARDMSLMRHMSEVLLSGDQGGIDRMMREVETIVFPVERLIDTFIPELVRRFGEDWLSDTIGFVDVTMASARLQSWLRALDSRADRGSAFAPLAAEVLVVVPEHSQHTLGAMVAMSQFRRLGAVVRLSLCLDNEAVGALVQRQSFDLVAISLAGGERLESTRALINKIRRGAGAVPKVMIGGNALALDPELGHKVGADAVTSDPRQALDICGHMTSSPDILPFDVPSRRARATAAVSAVAPSR